VGLIHDLRTRRRVRAKEREELRFWQGRMRADAGALGNSHFEEFFCRHSGLDRAFYDGKRILDIGCGPRGSLEWADMAAERVGLDPLVPGYRSLGIDGHEMTYVGAPAERIPFPAGHFDVVTTFNALDHVDDLDAALREIARVTAAGGTWLVAVEAGAPPSSTEPQTIPWDFLDGKEGWSTDEVRRIAMDDDHNVYKAWAHGVPWRGGPGLLVGRLRRR
jgi:SAM-dependent methyltransferase